MTPVTLTDARVFVRKWDVLALAYLAVIALLLLMPNPAWARNLFYFGVLPCFALVLDREGLASVTGSWTLRLGALLLCWLWLTLFWSDHATMGQIANSARRMLLILLFVAVTAYLAATVPDFGQRLFRCIAYVGGLAAAAAIIWAAVRSPTLPFVRVGAFPFPNANASCAVYGAAVVGAFCYLWPRAGATSSSWLDIVAIVTMALFCLLTQNRGSLIALGIALCAVSMRNHMRSALIVVAAGAITLSLLIALGIIDPTPLLARGDSYRLEAWTHYLEIWQRHPFRGVGLAEMPTFMSADGAVEIVHAHDIYLSHLVLGGVPALLLLLLLLTAAARAAWIRYAVQDDAGPAALLLFVTLSGLFDYSVFVDSAGWQWLYFWLPIGLAAGADIAAIQAPKVSAAVS